MGQVKLSFYLSTKEIEAVVFGGRTSDEQKILERVQAKMAKKLLSFYEHRAQGEQSQTAAVE